jgi:hypothetical protein
MKQLKRSKVAVIWGMKDRARMICREGGCLTR